MSADAKATEQIDLLPTDWDVHRRITAAIGLMPDIGKGTQNREQGYKFRGIEAVKTQVKKILYECGLHYVPRVLSADYGTYTTGKGSVMRTCQVHMAFTVYAIDGSSVESSEIGEGADIADKATSKAMSMAEKYMLNHVFCLADGTDGDRETPEGRASGHTSDRGGSTTSHSTSGGTASEAQLRMIRSIGNKLGFAGPLLKKLVADTIGHDVAHLADLTGGKGGEASLVIDALKAKEANGEMAPAAEADDPGPQEPPEGWNS